MISTKMIDKIHNAKVENEKESLLDDVESECDHHRRYKTWMNDLKLSTQAITSTIFQRRFEFREATHHNLKELAQLKHFWETYPPINVPCSASLWTTPKTYVSSVSPSSSFENTPEMASSNTALSHIPKDVLEHREWKEIRRIGPGLQNLGNTCFMNAVLQCLVYCPPLIHHLMVCKHSKICRTLGFCGYCELEHHVRRYFFQTQLNKSLVPRRFATHLRAICKQFRLGRQEDAHEFIRCLLDMIEKAYIQSHYGEDLLAANPKQRQCTIVQHIFGGQLQSQVKCLSCKSESNTYDPFLDICLDIKNCNTIEKAFAQYTLSEKLSKENRYKCDKCQQRVEAEKRMTIHYAPAILTVQFKRFDYCSGYGKKIGKHISFSEVLNLRSYMSEEFANTDLRYRLFAVLVHAGQSCNSGHYYCYVRNATEAWYCMNDDVVYQTSFAKVMQEPAYLLFYILDEGKKCKDVQEYTKENEIIQIRKIPCKTGILSEANGAIKTGHHLNGGPQATKEFPVQDFYIGSLFGRNLSMDISSDEEDEIEDDQAQMKNTESNHNQSTVLKSFKSHDVDLRKIESCEERTSHVLEVPLKKAPSLLKRLQRTKTHSKYKTSLDNPNSCRSKISRSNNIQVLWCHGTFFNVSDTAFRNHNLENKIFDRTSQQQLSLLSNRKPTSLEKTSNPTAISFRNQPKQTLIRPCTLDGVLAFRKAQKSSSMERIDNDME
jgi:ubiquitin C-terminal hydrolase